MDLFQPETLLHLSSIVGFWQWLGHVTPPEIKAYYWAALKVYGTPWFYLLIAVILGLEWLRPAMKSQRVFSRGLAEDFIWFNLDLIFKVAALPAFIGLLYLVYVHLTHGFTLPVPARWPTALQFIVALIGVDFLLWFHHWVRHHVRTFWHFHAIHHSQREMNLFTDLRVHFVEYLIAQVITFVPLFMFSLSPYAIVGVGYVTAWHTRLIHANVRTSYGPLRHMIVSPQFHRIHHSIEPRHRDKNFGVILTIWDRMFGTMYANNDEYPATGLDDVEFIPPADRSVTAWAGTIGRQIIYPFTAILPRRTRVPQPLPPRPQESVDRGA